jgi:DNA-binding transcriptional LysR family regulator
MGRPPQELETVSEPFAENPLVFVAAPDHPLAKAKSIAPRQLAGESFLLREPGSGTRAAMERFLAEHGVVPQRTVEMTSNETIKQAVMAGMGISFISERTIVLELATGHIARLNVAGTPLKRHWFVVHRAEKRLLPVAEAFRRFLLSESGSLDEPPKETGAGRKPPSAASGSSRARQQKAAGRPRR